jgi:hypothetical protein
MSLMLPPIYWGGQRSDALPASWNYLAQCVTDDGVGADDSRGRGLVLLMPALVSRNDHHRDSLSSE